MTVRRCCAARCRWLTNWRTAGRTITSERTTTPSSSTSGPSPIGTTDMNWAAAGCRVIGSGIRPTQSPWLISVISPKVESREVAPARGHLGLSQHIGHELEGAGGLAGTYPFTQARSHANLRINTFLHDLVVPEHRARFVNDFDALATERGLSDEEQALIKGRQWIELIRRGVSFFVLEKMAAVLGVPNPAVYAAFRGETLEQFLATRKVPLTYSVAGGDKVRQMDHT